MRNGRLRACLAGFLGKNMARGENDDLASVCWGGNIVLAGFLVGLCFIGVRPDNLESLKNEEAAYCVATLLLVVNVLRRQLSVESDVRPWVVCVCLASALSMFAFEWKSAESSDVSQVFVWPLICLQGLGDLCLIYLGRAFSILPARREVRTGFLYRGVRHPVYAIYIVFSMLFVYTNPSVRNVIVLFVGTALLVVRANLEERVLGRDPAYCAYRMRTRWMFIPFVY